MSQNNDLDNDDLLTFADSLFEECETTKVKKASAARITFEPNVITPTWFQLSQKEDLPQVLKYRADYLYYKEEFRSAAEVYEQCINAVPTSNRTLLKDAQESQIWCFLRLDELNTAKEKLIAFTEDLIASSSTFEQRTPSLFLGVQVYRACGFAEEYQLALKRGLCTHPLYSDWWLELGQSCLAQDETGFEKGLETLAIHNNCKKSESLTGVENTFARICLGLAEMLATRQAQFSTSFSKTYALELSRNASRLLESIPGGKLDLSRCVEQLLEKSTDMKNPMVLVDFESCILNWAKVDENHSHTCL